MKHLLPFLLLAALPASAQKLAPTTQLLLQRPVAASSKAQAPATLPDTLIQCFVEARPALTAADLESAGATCINEVAPGIFTLNIPLRHVGALESLSDVTRIEAASQLRPLMDVARADCGVDRAFHGLDNGLLGDYTGKGVVIGVVDTGFEYNHAAFYTNDKQTFRVSRVWNQKSYTGTSPKAFGYGAEYTSPAEIVAAGYDTGNTFHGTHVTGIAAGGDLNSKFHGVAPEAELVLVSFGGNNADIVNGVKYIFDYATSVGKPCVVNLSLGSHLGPHDGTSVVDRTFDAITGPGRLIVGAAGNEGTLALHATKTLTEADSIFKTMIGYTNENASNKLARLDIWADAGTDFEVKGVIIDALRGKIVKETAPIKASSGESLKEQYYSSECGVTGDISLAAAINPSNGKPNVTLETTATIVPENRRIGVIVTGHAGQTIHVWNTETGPLLSGDKMGWTKGNTDCTMDEGGGTGKSVISVGSYNTKLSYTTLKGDEYLIKESVVGALGDASLFSSHGPTVDGRTKPDVSAPGAAIIAAASQYAGVTAAYTSDISYGPDGKPYYYDVNAGTSMASPFVTGTIALWLQACPELTPEQALTIIKASARTDAFTNPDDSTSVKNPNQWGAGKIDAFAGLKLIDEGLTGLPSVSAPTDGLKVAYKQQAPGRWDIITAASAASPASLTLTDLTGRTVLSLRTTSATTTIDQPQLVHGIYLLTVQQGGRKGTYKLEW